jgi:hypothetical protein
MPDEESRSYLLHDTVPCSRGRAASSKKVLSCIEQLLGNGTSPDAISIMFYDESHRYLAPTNSWFVATFGMGIMGWEVDWFVLHDDLVIGSGGMSTQRSALSYK